MYDLVASDESDPLALSAAEVDKRIAERAAVIAVAIDARRQYYPEEQAYCYLPFKGREDRFRCNDENFAKVEAALAKLKGE